ncbi:hypothetical protein KIS4809_0214 [Bacillus sp. ZZV12-4809]|nr:hypothetical protein KIS4809_0214 [Bacillus sp. ZZV12-4809]
MNNYLNLNNFTRVSFNNKIFQKKKGYSILNNFFGGPK